MDIKKFLLGVALLAIGGTGASAHAAIMTIGDATAFEFATYDGLVDRNSGTDSANQHVYSLNIQRQNLSLDRFDASLGTLLDVDIWFESNWSLASTVDSVDPRSGNRVASARGRSASKQRIWLTDPYREVSANNEVLWSSCNDRPECTATSSKNGVFNDHFGLGAFTLADFIGTDALNFRLVRRLESDLRKCGAYDFCSHENANNAWSGNIYVNYTFVSEPSPLVLMGLGLLAIGAGVFRNRKA